MATISVPQQAQALLQRFEAAGYPSYLVGGAVRDLLLGQTPSDIDVATPATPDRVEQLAEEWGYKIVETGIAHGTVTLIKGETHFEVTTFREESGYSDTRHPDHVRFGVSLEEDIRRRDFTVSALAADRLGHVIDLVGGLDDLQRGLIRAVGDPDARMHEDALRMLRAHRLVAHYGFSIVASTARSIARNAPAILRISAERQRDELNKLLVSDYPDWGLEAMRETGLLPWVLPELAVGVGNPQHPSHAYDVFGHIVSAVAQVRPIQEPCVSLLTLRWAALCHDLAKPQTMDVGPDGRIHNYGHADWSARMGRRLLQRLRQPKRLQDEVSSLVREHLTIFEPHITPAGIRRVARRLGSDSMLWGLVAVARADRLGQATDPPQVVEADIQTMISRISEALAPVGPAETFRLAISGKEIMQRLGIGPGPLVGRWLSYLQEWVVEHPDQNRRELLLQLLDPDHPQPPAKDKGEPPTG